MSPISLAAQREALKKTWSLIAADDSSVLELRPIWPKGIPDKKTAQSVHFRIKDYESITACRTAFEAKALELNRQGFNVYTVMNPIRPCTLPPDRRAWCVHPALVKRICLGPSGLRSALPIALRLAECRMTY